MWSGKTWEYKIVDDLPDGTVETNQSFLNELGREGWEVVAVKGGDEDHWPHVWLKRPRIYPVESRGSRK